jgi:hypothetical protein
MPRPSPARRCLGGLTARAAGKLIGVAADLAIALR